MGVISTAREDWVSPKDSLPGPVEDEEPGAVKIKERRDDETLDSIQHSQANWIRQYMERQEEVSFNFGCIKFVLPFLLQLAALPGCKIHF